MADLKALNCPSCGASLTITGSEAQIVCPYCGTSVAVPEELRTKPVVPAAPQPTVQPEIVIVSPYAAPYAARTPYRARRSGCSGVISAVVLAFAAIAYVIVRNPSIAGPFLQAISVSRSASNAISGPSPILSAPNGDGPGQYVFIRNFVIDPDGNFYVTDTSTFRIQKFDANGKYVGSWNVDRGKATAGLDDLALDNSGHLYMVVDSAILKYDTSGNLLGRFSDIDKNSVGDHYYHIAVTPQGSIWAITFDKSLLHLDAQGKILDRISDPLTAQWPASEGVDPFFNKLFVDKSGNLFILDTDQYHPKVIEFSPDGKKVLAKFGDGGDTPGRFTRASDIVVDDQDRVYVSDASRVQVLDNQGRFLRNVTLYKSAGAYPYPSAMQLDGKGSLFLVMNARDIYKYDMSSTMAQ